MSLVSKRGPGSLSGIKIWYHNVLSSHCNSYEDPISIISKEFKWFASKIGHHESSPCNGRHSDKPLFRQNLRWLKVCWCRFDQISLMSFCNKYLLISVHALMNYIASTLFVRQLAVFDLTQSKYWLMMPWLPIRHYIWPFTASYTLISTTSMAFDYMNCTWT